MLHKPPLNFLLLLLLFFGHPGISQQPQLLLPVGHTSPITTVCFSPDGKFTATNGGEENMVKLWETRTGRLLNTFIHANEITSVSFSPDGKWLLTTGYDQHAKIWDMTTFSLYYDIDFYYNNWIENGFFSRDGKKVVLVANNGIASFDLGSRKRDRFIPGEIAYYYANALTMKDSLGRKNMFRIGSEGKDPDNYTYVTWIAVSEDCNTSIFLSKDSSFSVHDLSTGTLIYHEKSKDFINTNCDITLKGDKYLTSSSDNKVRVYETGSLKLIQTISLKPGMTLRTRFSRDGEKLYTSSVNNKGGLVEQWDIKSGQKENSFAMPDAEFCFDMCQSPDGKWMLTSSSDGAIRLWETATGKFVRIVNEMSPEVKALMPVVEKNYYRSVQANFSSDTKYIISTSVNTVSKIQETLNGRSVSTLEGRSALIFKPRYSYDGNLLASIGWKENIRLGTRIDGVVSIWDLQTGKKILSLEGHGGNINDINFSHDNKYLASAANDSTVRIWNLSNGQVINILKGHEKAVNKCYFTADDKYIITQTSFGMGRIFETETGRLITTIKNDFNPGDNTDKPEKGKSIYYSRLSASGKYLLSCFYDDKYYIRETSSGKLLRKFDAKKDSTSYFAFDPSEKWFRYFHDSTIYFADIESGRILRTFPFTKKLNNIAVSSDGKMMTAISSTGLLQLWETGSGKSLSTVNAVKKSISEMNFTSDDKYLITYSYDTTIRAWSVPGLQLVYTIRLEANDMYGFSLIRENKYYIFTRSHNGMLKTWDLENGKMLSSVLDKFNHNLDYIIHPTRPQFIIDNHASADFHNIVNGYSPLLQIIPVSNTDYLFTDNAGRYDGTEGAKKLLYFTCGAEIIELDQVKQQLWIPALAERILKNEKINTKSLEEYNVCGLTPKVEEKGTAGNAYLFTVMPGRGGLGETILYINGIEAKRYPARQLKKIQDRYELIIPKQELDPYFIAGKENHVMIKALTSNNTVSSRGAKITVDETGKPVAAPNLFAVMVGVSDYKGTELDLRYAAKDANDISAAISNAAKKLLNTDGKEHVFMYNLTTEANRYKLPEKNSIKQVLAEIGTKAAPNDILLVFFAGHGVMDAVSKKFYFLTADASQSLSVSSVADVGISTAELTDWIQPINIKAQKRILIFDACNSGQAIKDLVQIGKKDQQYMSARNDDKAQQAFAIERLNEKAGLFILSASASNQSAYELGQYSQGLLTYSLLKAIKEDAEILENGKYLNISRWFNSAEKTVSEVARENSERQEPQIVTNTNFIIGIVDEEVMTKIVLPQAKAAFTISNLQNSDENISSDDQGLNNLIDQHLSSLSERGTNGNITFNRNNSPRAFALGGRYDVKGETITARVNIRQDKEIKFRFEVSGSINKLKELAASIAEKAAQLVN